MKQIGTALPLSVDGKSEQWMFCAENSEPGIPVFVSEGFPFYFWKFVHNALIHPLLAFPWSPRWIETMHDWTARRCWGAG